MKKIVFTGGGTAGHVVPNIAIMEEVKNKAEIYYIGSDKIEKDLITKLNIPFYTITTTKLKRSFSLSNFLIPFKLFKAIKEAKKILKQIKPDVVFSKGGYVALPVVFACKKLNIKVICHESDMSLGLANRLCKNKCKYVCTSFEKTAKEIKNGIFTGSPLRKALFSGNKENIKKLFKNYSTKPNILIFGGSLGSQIINKVVYESLPKLKDYNILHITGKNNIKKVDYNNYVGVEFLNNMGDAYSFADIVICRAGSNAINELLALNKPNILIPLSKKASRGDQILNANYFKEKGYSEVILEENLTTDSLVNSIKNLFKNKEKFISTMKKTNLQSANKKIAQLLLED